MHIQKSNYREIQTLGNAIRRARDIRQITQRELAELCETTRDLITKWECDRRPIDDATWLKIAHELGLPRPLKDKLAMDPILGGEGALLLCPRRMHYEPPRDRKTHIRLLAFRGVDRKLFDRLWTQLKGRGDWVRTRRFLLVTWADGRYEVELWMYLLGDGAVAEWNSPLRCGYRILPYVDPRTRECVGDCRMPSLVRYDPERPAIVFPQATLLAGNEVLRVDGLVGMRFNGVTRWGGYEFERKGAPSLQTMQERSERFRMPLVFLAPEDLQGPDFPATFWDLMYHKLWPTAGMLPAAA